MKSYIGILLNLVLVVCFVRLGNAADTEEKKFLLGFLAGEYELIGRTPDSATTYSGRVVIRVEGDILQVTRAINGVTSMNSARIEKAGESQNIPILRMRFQVDGVEYEGAYRWQSDFDNHPRFTGILYRVDRKSESRGIEALFPVHP